MSFFRRRNSNNEVNYKARLEHKLYLARENPEPFFDLADCALKDVPAGIYSLCKVFRKEALLLQDNQLSSLTGGGNLHDLALLQVLDLHNNCLNSLPEELQCLCNLRVLNLSDNQLRHLPSWIGSLERLNSLNVANNKLSDLPKSVAELTQLVRLDVRGNSKLTLRKLPPEIARVPPLEELLMDEAQLGCVPKDAVAMGVVGLLSILAEENGFTYVPLSKRDANAQVKDDGILDLFELEERERGFKAQKQKELLLVEAFRDETQKVEFEARQSAKQCRGKLLADLALQHDHLEKEVHRVQKEREVHRQRFIEHLQEVEQNADELITQLLSQSDSLLNRQAQQWLKREKQEEEELLLEVQQEQKCLQRRDVLHAMQILVEEECQRERTYREYEHSRNEMTRSLLSKELESDRALLNAVDSHALAQSELVGRLQKDEELQRAAVSALLERSDARSWGLVQHVALVENQLAALTALELQRRKHQLSEQLSDLTEKRVALSNLLLQLLEEQNSRRQQLLHTLDEMQQFRNGDDFWLHQYQRLMDTRPGLVNQQRTLDPMLAHNLLMQGVIHCLPFLARWVQQPEFMNAITDHDLRQAGLTSAEDRKSVLKAIRLYLEERSCAQKKIGNSFDEDADFRPIPSAPVLEDRELRKLSPSAPEEKEEEEEERTPVPVEEVAAVPGTSGQSNEGLSFGMHGTVNAIAELECVICLDIVCEVIILPCGHLCCCAKCCEPLSACPLCRSEIERKIRITSQ